MRSSGRTGVELDDLRALVAVQMTGMMWGCPAPQV